MLAVPTRTCRLCNQERPTARFRRGRNACRSCERRQYKAGPLVRDDRRAAIYLIERVEIVSTGYVTPCWLWQRAIEERGYARAAVPGFSKRMVHVHRASVEIFKGPIPEGFEVDHLCRNTSCVNPSHLESVTPEENRKRQIAVCREEAAARNSRGSGGASSGRLYHTNDVIARRHREASNR